MPLRIGPASQHGAIGLLARMATADGDLVARDHVISDEKLEPSTTLFNAADEAGNADQAYVGRQVRLDDVENEAQVAPIEAARRVSVRTRETGIHPLPPLSERWPGAGTPGAIVRRTGEHRERPHGPLAEQPRSYALEDGYTPGACAHHSDGVSVPEISWHDGRAASRCVIGHKLRGDEVTVVHRRADADSRHRHPLYDSEVFSTTFT